MHQYRLIGFEHQCHWGRRAKKHLPSPRAYQMGNPSDHFDREETPGGRSSIFETPHPFHSSSNTGSGTGFPIPMRARSLLFIGLNLDKADIPKWGEMNPISKKKNQKGDTSANFLVLGVLIVLGVVCALKYLQYRSDVITIHLPGIESR